MLTSRTIPRLRLILVCVIAATSVSACTPTVRLEIAPLEIYAKLDVNVQVRLDQELQDLLRENPNLF